MGLKFWKARVYNNRTFVNFMIIVSTTTTEESLKFDIQVFEMNARRRKGMTVRNHGNCHPHTTTT